MLECSLALTGSTKHYPNAFSSPLADASKDYSVDFRVILLLTCHISANEDPSNPSINERDDINYLLPRCIDYSSSQPKGTDGGDVAVFLARCQGDLIGVSP